MKKIKTYFEKTTYTYAYLRSISYLAYKRAKETKEGRFNNCIIAMMFSAFCVEAYLNHVGQKKIKFWAEVDKCSPKQKVAIIAIMLKHEIDWGKAPFQTFCDIFRFRNKLVHGRTHHVIVEEMQFLEEEDSPASALVDWEREITLENAERYLKDVKEIIELLHAKAGFKGDALSTLSQETSWA